MANINFKNGYIETHVVFLLKIFDYQDLISLQYLVLKFTHHAVTAHYLYIRTVYGVEVTIQIEVASFALHHINGCTFELAKFLF